MIKKKGQFLLMLYPGCISFETMLAVQLLGRKLELKTATPGGETHVDESGMKICADFSYKDALEHKFHTILVPGGDPEEIMGLKVVDEIILAAVANGVVVAGICAGVLVLAKTGILKGRKITHNYGEKYAPAEIVDFAAKYWNDCNYFDLPVVVDQNVVTALPFAHIDFATKVAELSGCLGNAEAGFLNNYYKGHSNLPLKTVEEFWRSMQTNDFFKAGRCLSDEFELFWPQSGELIKGRENFAQLNSAYPASGNWKFKINRIFSCGSEVVSDVAVTDGSVVGRAITFSTVENGLIAKQVEFWPDCFEAPDWRRRWVEKIV